MSELDKKVKDALQTRLEDLLADNPAKRIDIANAIGISSGSLSGYINANKEAGICNLVRIADYFNVSTDYLLGRTEVSSTDDNIKISCKTTGLNEKAISVIRSTDFNLQDEDCFLSRLDMLNMLFADKELLGLFASWVDNLIETHDFSLHCADSELTIEQIYAESPIGLIYEYSAVKATGYICNRLRELSVNKKEINNAE